MCTHCVWTCPFQSLSISVDADEIKRLGKRFKKLDLDNSGSLSVEEFMSLPELQQNPLVQRVIDIFDTDGNGEVDFKGELRIIAYGVFVLTSNTFHLMSSTIALYFLLAVMHHGNHMVALLTWLIFTMQHWDCLSNFPQI